MSKNIFNIEKMPKLPQTIKSFWGDQISCYEDEWPVTDIAIRHTFKFQKFKNRHLRDCLKLYLGTLAVSKSLSHVKNSYYVLINAISNVDGANLSLRIQKSIDKYISENRNTNNEYTIWYIKDWYNWCLDLFIPYFDEGFSDYLSNISISGNAKGQAVLSLEENEGPLTEQELGELVKVLANDSEISQGKVLAYLFLTLGTNPRNICLLKWEDFAVITSGTYSLYKLNVPRIKKRFRNRIEFRTRELDSRVGKIIQEFKYGKKEDYVFVSSSGLPFTIQALRFELQSYLSRLFSGTALEGTIISPRRLRYTFATRLVMSGVSKERLADLLDHSDLQHVQIYYDLRHKIKGFLTEAENGKLGTLFGRFEGVLNSKESSLKKDISYNSEKINSPIGNCGSNSVCELVPPYSCITCKKFNAFEDSLAWYEIMLKDLLIWRKNRLDSFNENDKIHSQMDEVIAALKDLIGRIKDGSIE